MSLDDTVIWGALAQMADATDPLVAQFARRLRDRDPYKCHDIRAQVTHALNPENADIDEVIERIDRCCAAISKKLTDRSSSNSENCPRLLIDNEQRSPYKSVGESKGPLDRINIRTDGGVLVDLKE